MTREQAKQEFVRGGVPENFFEVMVPSAVGNEGDWCVKWWKDRRIGLRFTIEDGFQLNLDSALSPAKGE